jgi:hypothetical protein
MRRASITKRASVLAALGSILGVGIAALAVTAQAGGDKVAFPADYAKGVVYMTLDRPENKQVREYVTSQAAVDAARKGDPLPQGTVITVAQYAAQLDAEGNPVKDPSGRFVKTSNIVGYTVMEKRAGWGAEYPEAQRNGEWEYQAFRADKTANPNANLTACFNCHKPQAGQDFVFSYQSMKTAAR